MWAFILALYANPKVRVKVNGHLLDAFPIYNRTRQVCPLSPLLYILTLELLLCCIRANTDIKGIRIRDREFKIAALADDILLFLASPLTSLPNLLQILEHFKLLSNLKINYSKSFALNVSIPLELAKQYQLNFPFQWKKGAVTYLVIQLPADLTELYSRNFQMELQNARRDLQKWDKPTTSWFERASILKMMVLPRLLYKLQKYQYFPKRQLSMTS